MHLAAAKRSMTGAFLLIALAALALRTPFLDLRPLHNDEAVNAVKFGELRETGVYRYDPNEHHGPSLWYTTLAWNRISGRAAYEDFSAAGYRWVTVVFGLGVVLLVPWLRDGLGRRGAAWAALFLAVSPAMVFYSRYYIHEMPLLFAATLALAAGWRYWRTRRVGWAVLAGAGLGLMHATKETFVLSLGAAALALLINQAWNRQFDASGPPVRARCLNPWHLAAALGAWVVVAGLLFSSFFTHFQGLADSVLTYRAWLGRAGGETDHVHPWHFYLRRLVFFHRAGGPIWSEGLLLALALAGAWAGFSRRGLGRANASLVRFLALYAFLLAGFYSFLPYKTTWCLLNFWQPAILLAGVGAAVLLRLARRRLARLGATALVLAGAGWLAWQAWQLDTRYAADPRNPYVYAQTSPDLRRLVDRIESLAEASPEGHETLIQVMCAEGDYWPLPWYLRSFHRIGWWDHLVPEPPAPIMIVSAGFDAQLDAGHQRLMTGFYELRPGVFLELYVDLELWKAWLAQQPLPL